MGPLIPLFWISGDVSSGFQSQTGQPYSHLAEAYVLHVPCPLGSQHGSQSVLFCEQASVGLETGIYHADQLSYMYRIKSNLLLVIYLKIHELSLCTDLLLSFMYKHMLRSTYCVSSFLSLLFRKRELLQIG